MRTNVSVNNFRVIHIEFVDISISDFVISDTVFGRKYLTLSCLIYIYGEKREIRGKNGKLFCLLV